MACFGKKHFTTCGFFMAEHAEVLYHRHHYPHQTTHTASVITWVQACQPACSWLTNDAPERVHTLSQINQHHALGVSLFLLLYLHLSAPPCCT